MTVWLEEFLIIINASLRLRIVLFAIPIVPSLIMLFGVFQLHSPVAVGPYSPLIVAVREGVLYFYLAGALLACIGCMRIAVKEYRRVRNRLFG